MTPQTLLLRQIHPSFIHAERVTSQAFRPTPKDQSKLSVENGDEITPEAAWQRFVQQPSCNSAGVMAINQKECIDIALPVVADGVPYPEHVSLDFEGFANSHVEKLSKLLVTKARARGWLYEAG